MPTYQPGVPTGTIKLNQDYQNLQNNFTQLNTVFGIDHLPFTNSTSQLGYHTAIHLVPQNTPATTTGYGQIYSKTVNDGFATDQELFFLTGGGLNLQLTRNLLPQTTSSGFTFLPGGLILQWGKVNGPTPPNNTFLPGSTGVVTFATANKAFPNSLLNVWTTLFYNSMTAGIPNNAESLMVAIDVTGTSKTQFTWRTLGFSNKFTAFYWYALGT